MYHVFKALLRAILRRLYRVEVHGLDNYRAAGSRVLIVANHTSFLDAVLLAAFLPDRLTFAIDTHQAQTWYGRLARFLVDLFPLNPMNPLSTKALIKYLKDDRKAVIFPEGRITITGALMKIYQGPGLIADKSGALVVPVRIDGAQYTPFSRLKGRVRIRWFPQISLTILPARRLSVEEGLSARERRDRAGQILSDLMTEMMFATSYRPRTLLQSLLDARYVHGGKHIVVEDVERRPLSYDQLLRRIFVLGAATARDTRAKEYVGILLPNMVSAVVTFLALHAFGRVPAMLNFTLGNQALKSACATARIKVIYTSRRFVSASKLEKTVEALAQDLKIIYLEDLGKTIGLKDKLRGALRAMVPEFVLRRTAIATATDAAVVLFTSGSEGTPKGVVLSHANIVANLHQLSARVDFNSQDIIMNPLPLFHSFGLTAGTILPLLSGMRVFFYPSPLHYRVIPEVAYSINATILFGTNTFLAGYARFAHPYDFHSLRYVFAGAEKLKDDVRQRWESRFGVRILEGYGATETSPVLACNTAMALHSGTVGRFLPGIQYRLEPVPGIEDGGRLYVSGPNVMLGYLLHANPGVLVPPTSSAGDGWYDTGDIVSIDAEGFVTIRGRAKRFAKIGGEMVSLAAVETLATHTWPEAQHAVVTVPDEQKGEQLVLVTTRSNAHRASLLEQAKREGVGEITVPRKILVVKELPLLGTGKTDYPGVQALAATGAAQ